jgi:predicted nucleic acid-binding protein
MKSFKNLEIVDVNKKIAEKAFEYQKKFDLGIFDSFHAATCFFLDKKIVSTDKIYDRIKEIKRLTPRNFSKLSTN